MLEIFGPAEKLHAALRRRVPQMAAALIRDDKTGLPYVRVTYRNAGPYVVEWDASRYRWQSGPDEGEQLGDDPEDAADAIADALGAARPDTSGT